MRTLTAHTWALLRGKMRIQQSICSIGSLNRGVHLSEFFIQPPKGATSHKTLRKGRKPARPRHKKK